MIQGSSKRTASRCAAGHLQGRQQIERRMRSAKWPQLMFPELEQQRVHVLEGGVDVLVALCASEDDAAG